MNVFKITFWFAALSLTLPALAKEGHLKGDLRPPRPPATHGWQMEGDVVSMTGAWARTRPAAPRWRTWSGDCRERIAQVVCLVGKRRSGESNLDRPCLSGSRDYVPLFESLYDRFPEPLQKMFCSLEKLYVEQDLQATAYVLRDAPIIGIRASLIDRQMSLDAWSTWKEQLSFGGSIDSYQVRSDLPRFEGQGDRADVFLYSVIAHEFGHLFDFANHLNAMEGNEPASESWTALSWSTYHRPKAGNDFTGRDGLCFYSCDGRTLPKSAVPDLYEQLYRRTNFLNTYTAQNAYEDWADSFSFYLLFRNLPVTYQLDTEQGEVYDLREKMNSELFASKRKYVEAFLARPDVVYPQ